jgi:hypothetical protein
MPGTMEGRFPAVFQQANGDTGQQALPELPDRGPDDAARIAAIRAVYAAARDHACDHGPESVDSELVARIIKEIVR